MRGSSRWLPSQPTGDPGIGDDAEPRRAGGSHAGAWERVRVLTNIRGGNALFLPKETCHDVRMSPFRIRANGVPAECVGGRLSSIAGQADPDPDDLAIVEVPISQRQV
jgi:hypothetical protein